MIEIDLHPDNRDPLWSLKHAVLFHSPPGKLAVWLVERLNAAIRRFT